MDEALMLTFAVSVPFLCLGLLLWLARLEETLVDGIESRSPVLEPAVAPALATAVAPAVATAAVTPAASVPAAGATPHAAA